ncbi:MAG: hypothetical protein ACPK85_07600 [Methanosarcina sp.]
MTDNKAKMQKVASQLGVAPEKLESVMGEVFPEMASVISGRKALMDNNCFNCARPAETMEK